MSEKRKRVVFGWAVLVALAVFVILDVHVARQENGKSPVSLVNDAAAKSGNKAVVTLVTSMDKELKNPAPLDTEKVTDEQVNAAVRRALDMDKSETSLVKVIKPTDWVLVKINMVSAPVQDKDGKRKNSNFWNHDFEHWGDVTDARVVKSVIGYMVEKVKPKRITIVEGSGTWAVAGKRGQGSQYDRASFDDDGWTIHWKEFDNICYKELCEEFTKSQNHTVVDYVDLNEDKYKFVPVPGYGLQRTDMKSRGQKFGKEAWIPGTGKLREGYYMPETMLNADKLVNIPAMKMNSMGGTLVFKNYVGAFSSFPYNDGVAKSQMDRYGISQGMVDIFSYRPTNYAVIAGFWGSEKDWPSWTLNLHHNVVIAGGNPVATEATALRVMGVNPDDVVWTHLAVNKGFGSYDEKDITVVGKQVREVRRNFIKHSAYQGIGFQNYLMNGPYQETDLNKDILGGEASIKPSDGQSASTGRPWWVFKHPLGLPEAYVSLNEAMNDDLANTITYAYVCLKSPRKQEGNFMFGFDDGAKVYLNGKVILNDDGPHEFKLREQAIPVVLEKGENHLLIKLKNRFGPAGFASSIEDTSKTMLYDMEVVVPKEKGMAQPGKSAKL
ncbi:MAG: DUF362 domain-containing protein [Candidatus Latescibacter sp.]|nr:DUF362 domain-containing protein [Candidatus Latescibacter sp.]